MHGELRRNKSDLALIKEVEAETEMKNLSRADGSPEHHEV